MPRIDLTPRRTAVTLGAIVVICICPDGPGWHGFLRNPTYAVLDAPGAGTKSGQGTQALSINDAGEISGIYLDSNSVEHGFVRDASGVYTSFDVPTGAALTSAFINASGTVAGTYNYKTVGANYTYGYVRDTSGNITTFDVPGSVYGNIVSGIDSAGAVTGADYSSTVITQEYVRDQYGNITTTNITGYLETAGIEDNGNVVGAYQVPNSITLRGWQVTPAGAVSYFRDPARARRAPAPLASAATAMSPATTMTPKGIRTTS